MARFISTYEDLIAWVANNDNPHVVDFDEIYKLPTVHVIYNGFNVPLTKIVADILDIRNPEWRKIIKQKYGLE